MSVSGTFTGRTEIISLAEHGYRPGMIGQIIQLMSSYYYSLFDFDLSFEAEQAQALAHFLMTFCPDHGGLWYAVDNGELIGCAALDGCQETVATGFVRWVILAPEARGRGLGKALLDRVISHSEQAGFRSLHLHTSARQHEAIRLYERSGFTLQEQRLIQIWGSDVVLCHYVRSAKVLMMPNHAAPILSRV